MRLSALVPLLVLTCTGVCLPGLCYSAASQISVPRRKGGFGYGLGHLLSSFVGLGAGTFLGCNVVRSLVGSLHPSEMINATDVELRLVTLEAEQEKTWLMIHKIYRAHNDELAKIKLHLSNLTDAFDPRTAANLAALSASVLALEESLSTLRQSLPTQLLESETRVMDILTQIRELRDRDSEVIREEMNAVRELIPTLAKKQRRLIFSRLRHSTEDIKTMVQNRINETRQN